MEPTILWEIVQQNANHIQTINHELGGMMADVAMIKWFMGINIVAWVGLMVATIGRKIFRNNKDNKK